MVSSKRFFTAKNYVEYCSMIKKIKTVSKLEVCDFLIIIIQKNDFMDVLASFLHVYVHVLIILKF